MLRLVVFEVGTDRKSSTIALGWQTESCLFWPTDCWTETRRVSACTDRKDVLDT